MFASMEEINYR